MIIWHGPIWIDALSDKVNVIEVQDILKKIGFDQRFNTEQTAICVISLFDNHPKLIRIHDIIVHAKKKLGKNYAENTRESIRKLSLKRLVNHGLAIYNKDDPQRPTNSGLANYCLTDEFYEILNKPKSRESLIESWNKLHKTMAAQIEDTTHNISVRFPNGKTYTLSPGPHNLLEKYIVEKFIPCRIKKPEIVYLGDAREKMLYVNHDLIRKLGIVLDEHDKLPDVIAWSPASHKFYVIESVTSVGPVEESRKKEIDQVINKKSGKKFNIVYTTAFLDRKTFSRFAGIIASNTFVWIAAEPDGLIQYSEKGIDL